VYQAFYISSLTCKLLSRDNVTNFEMFEIRAVDRRSREDRMERHGLIGAKDKSTELPLDERLRD
jgi:hypothetical protein